MIDQYITPFIKSAYHITDEMEYSVETVAAERLLCANRLDIIAKYQYLIDRDRIPETAKKNYLEHIRCMTKGSFFEAGSEKQGEENFITCFDALFENIRKNGYSEQKIPVPVDRNMQIIDGAHRVAVCLALHLPVRIVHLPVDGIYDCYDYRYFQSQGMDSDLLDKIVLGYIRLKKNTVCFNIWPAAKGHEEELARIMENNFQILYRKQVTLNENGAFHYLAQIYSEYSWAQNDGDGFSGVYRKLLPCFPDFKPIQVWFVESDFFEHATEIKLQLRDLFGLEKHSLHATDNHRETEQMAEILLSRNSIEFMNKGNSIRFKSTFQLLQEARQFNPETTVFTGSLILALYGIREAQDLDYISLDHPEGSHNSFLNLYGMSLNEAVYDPSNYFYYFGMKFVTLKRVMEFKERRNEGKDADDLLLMKSLQKNAGKEDWRIHALQKKRKIIAEMQGMVLRFAHKTGTYNFLRSMYKRLKGGKA